MHMFCYQCQETGMERGCLYFGACGKTEETANLQDLLLHIVRGIAFWAEPGLEEGSLDRASGLFICKALFSTITNTNFDSERFINLIREGIHLRNKMRALYESRVSGPLPDSATWDSADADAMYRKSLAIDIRSQKNTDLRSMQELTVYGLKGVGAYVHHAAALGYYDDSILDFVIRAFAAMNHVQDESQLETSAIGAGKIMIAAMALLDNANASVYGPPEITEVPIGVRKRPGILVTGHDLKDLQELLEQSRGEGIDIYTHSEMWAAHQYPFFKKFEHLAGNYSKALYLCGTDYTVDELLKLLSKDIPFYNESGGGVTVSGGEPLCQPEFVLEILKGLKELGIHTALDTTGYADSEIVESVLPYTDLFLYDLKNMDNEQHRVVTGVPNDLILQNARLIANAGGKMQIRIPIIPEFNDSEDSIRETGEFCKSLGHAVTVVQLLPYHNLGVMKYQRLDDTTTILEATPPSEAKIAALKEVLETLGLAVTVH